MTEWSEDREIFSWLVTCEVLNLKVYNVNLQDESSFMDQVAIYIIIYGTI